MKKSHSHAKSQTMFSMMYPMTIYSHFTPADIFDLRCEYEVPRYMDLNRIDEEPNEDFFNWF